MIVTIVLNDRQVTGFQWYLDRHQPGRTIADYVTATIGYFGDNYAAEREVITWEERKALIESDPELAALIDERIKNDQRRTEG